jgi:hypothetical protein
MTLLGWLMEFVCVFITYKQNLSGVVLVSVSKTIQDPDTNKFDDSQDMYLTYHCLI